MAFRKERQGCRKLGNGEPFNGYEVSVLRDDKENVPVVPELHAQLCLKRDNGEVRFYKVRHRKRSAFSLMAVGLCCHPQQTLEP